MQPFSSIDREPRASVRLQQNRPADGRTIRSAHANKQYGAFFQSKFTKLLKLSLNGGIAGVCPE